MIKNKSLKTAILFRLVIPLLFFVIIDAVLSYFVTTHFVDQAYDRWLLDSVNSLAQEIKINNGQISVELPPAALEMFNWDEQDQTYFKINSSRNLLLAGEAKLPEFSTSGEMDWSQPVFFNARFNAQPVRIASMRMVFSDTDEVVYIHVAETMNKRNAMMVDILLSDLLPQLALVLISGIYLFSGLNRGLQPLHTLAKQIAGRSARDLNPIPETHVFIEVKTLTDTINTLLQQLTDAIETQQRFIANAAHQLRTPLAGLKLQAERALREQDIHAMQPALKQLQTSADRMSHLTSQLLVLAKSEPINHYELHRVDLAELTRQVCIAWVPKALQRGMEISLDNPPASIMILGDEILLTELMTNVLDNAVMYGHQAGNINVKLLDKPVPTLIIEDDGPGIAEAERAKVLERFYRISGSPGDGCGLGLAIVKEIAELHHADVTLAKSAELGGLMIKVEFN